MVPPFLKGILEWENVDAASVHQAVDHSHQPSPAPLPADPPRNPVRPRFAHQTCRPPRLLLPPRRGRLAFQNPDPEQGEVPWLWR